MKILFDQCVPYPLKNYIVTHDVKSAYEMGWSNLKNGELISRAEQEFEVFVTTDKNLKYQQNLQSRKIAILVLPTTSWKKIESRKEIIISTIEEIQTSQYIELEF